jgi:uncharacterized HAD superfamily protein
MVIWYDILKLGEGASMYFAVDIDGTIAGANIPLLLSLCNKKLKLGIDEGRLQGIRYEDFLALPEVMTHRSTVGERRFAWNLRLLALDPEHQVDMVPLDHAAAAVTRLAQQGTLAYYTARVTSLEALNVQIARATTRWLAKHGFPAPSDVVICTSPKDKLSRLSSLIQETGENVMLIDDHYEQLLSDVSLLDERDSAALDSSLILCAFGAREVPTHPLLRVVALSDWSQVDLALHAAKEGVLS